eukprot:gene4258-8475_t
MSQAPAIFKCSMQITRKSSQNITWNTDGLNPFSGIDSTVIFPVYFSPSDQGT